MAVVALADRDDLAALARVARGLDRDVGRLAAARPVDHPPHVRRAGGHERLGERGAGERREVVVADVEAAHRLLEHGDQLGIAMAEVVRAAVEVQVDQPPARHVPEQVALAAVDHEVDAGVLPEPRLVRVPELLRAAEEVRLGLEREEAVVVHVPRLGAERTISPPRSQPLVGIGLCPGPRPGTPSKSRKAAASAAAGARASRSAAPRRRRSRAAASCSASACAQPATISTVASGWNCTPRCGPSRNACGASAVRASSVAPGGVQKRS